MGRVWKAVSLIECRNRLKNGLRKRSFSTSLAAEDRALEDIDDRDGRVQGGAGDRIGERDHGRGEVDERTRQVAAADAAYHVRLGVLTDQAAPRRGVTPQRVEEDGGQRQRHAISDGGGSRVGRVDV